MAFRFGDRYQGTLFPSSLDDLVPEDCPVRVYNDFIDALDLSDLGIIADENSVGNPSYDPRSMLKLLVYGYSYGIRSSRKLEREVHYNVSFIWLMGGLKPDHKTISEFRRRNKKALRNVLGASARMCIHLDLIAGNTLFVDGSKFRANAGIKSSRSREQCERDLAKVGKRINEILRECESVDKSETGLPSYVKIKEELMDRQARKDKIEEVMREMKENGKKSHNWVDPDSTRVCDRHGVHSGYIAQIVVDEKNGLIVSNDVVGESNELGQLNSQVEQAHEILGRQCETVCADSGYDNPSEMERVAENGIKVVVPPQNPKANREITRFDKLNFQYNAEGDFYICPMGHRLVYTYPQTARRAWRYMVEDRQTCLSCLHFGECTKSKSGRTICRYWDEESRKRFEAEYNKPESQEVYRLRKQRVEHPFGHIKRNLGTDHFLLRGLEGVRAEMSLLAACFNLRRMMTIGGIAQLRKSVRLYATKPVT